MPAKHAVQPGARSRLGKTSALLMLAGIGASLVSGCSTFGERQGGSITTTHLPAAANTVALGTEAETRLVITTPNRRDGASAVLTCSEPSPDIALIAANAFSGSIGASGALFNDGTSDQARASLAATRAEQAAELGRRLATVQLARDTLFRACEAYANGAIDEVMYSVMLSRFDDLMVALFAVEMAQGGDPNEAQVGLVDIAAVNAALTAARSEAAETAEGEGATEQRQADATVAAISGPAFIRRPGRDNNTGSENVENIAEAFFNDANGDAAMVACISALLREDSPAAFRTLCTDEKGILAQLFRATENDTAMRRRTEYVQAMTAAINAAPEEERAAVARALAAGMRLPRNEGDEE